MQVTAERTTKKAPAIRPSSSLKITKLGEHVGAEATGVDLTKPIDDDTRKRLNDAVVEHIALVVRDQHFTPEQFLEASRVFGTPMVRPSGEHLLAGLPLVHQVSSRQVDKTGYAKKVGTRWHTDHTNLEAPAKYTMLYAAELPRSGGGTSVCSMRAGYQALSPALKQRIDGLKTVNVILGSAVKYYGRGLADTRATQQQLNPDPVIHPLVVTHPQNGSKALFFNPLKTENIVGMTPEDTQELLEELIATAVQPEFVYTHQWRMGDMFLWDNRASLHRAGSDYDSAKDGHRTLYRIIIEGDKLS